MSSNHKCQCQGRQSQSRQGFQWFIPLEMMWLFSVELLMEVCSRKEYNEVFWHETVCITCGSRIECIVFGDYDNKAQFIYRLWCVPGTIGGCMGTHIPFALGIDMQYFQLWIVMLQFVIWSHFVSAGIHCLHYGRCCFLPHFCTFFFSVEK